MKRRVTSNKVRVRTDKILIARPRLHFMQRRKSLSLKAVHIHFGRLKGTLVNIIQTAVGRS